MAAIDSRTPSASDIACALSACAATANLIASIHAEAGRHDPESSESWSALVTRIDALSAAAIEQIAHVETALQDLSGEVPAIRNLRQAEARSIGGGECDSVDFVPGLNCLFDIRALANAAFQQLEGEPDEEMRADTYRLARMILERTDGGIKAMNDAEAAYLRRGSRLHPAAH